MFTTSFCASAASLADGNILVIKLGAIGVWIGLSCGTAAYAALLIGRFYLLTKRLQPQSVAPVTAPRFP